MKLLALLFALSFAFITSTNCLALDLNDHDVKIVALAAQAELCGIKLSEKQLRMAPLTAILRWGDAAEEHIQEITAQISRTYARINATQKAELCMVAIDSWEKLGR